MRNKFLYYLILIFLLPNPSQSEEFQVGQAIQWKPIPGAYGYIVEVRDSSGKQIVRESIPSTELEINLSEGNYQFRIIALNKFKKVGKVYPWKELIIKPVSSPIVTSSPSKFNPSDEKTEFVAKGKFLHRGTRVELKDENDKIYPTEVVVLPDGSGIKVIPPKDLPEGDYSVEYKNSRGKPFQNSVAVVSIVQTKDPLDSDSDKSEVTSLDKNKSDKTITNINKDKDQVTDSTNQSNNIENKESLEDEITSREYSIWSIFWRQALIPGWGHYHAGYKKTGVFYTVGTVLLVGAVAHTNQVYAQRRKEYVNEGNINNLLNFQGDVDPNLGVYNQLNLQSKFESSSVARIQAGNSIAALAVFYIINLAHIAITGYTNEDSLSNMLILESVPEIWQNEMGTKYRAGVKFNF